MSHLMDKAAESVVGFCPVLPGAFSAYRWTAIRGAPLGQYFMLEETLLRDISPFTANRYLAEDRVLCLEIVCAPGRAWVLRWVRGAVAETDVPATLVELIKQRRRWVNGAFFSTLSYLLGFTRMLGSGHHALRKALFVAQFGYQLLTAVLSWFSVSLLMVALMSVYGSAIDRATTVGSSVNSGLRGCFTFLYVMLLLSQVILALVGGNVARLASYYQVVTAISGLIVGVSVLLGSWLASSGGISTTVLLSLGLLTGSYALVALLYGRAVEMASVFVQFTLSS